MPFAYRFVEIKILLVKRRLGISPSCETAGHAGQPSSPPKSIVSNVVAFTPSPDAIAPNAFQSAFYKTKGIPISFA